MAFGLLVSKVHLDQVILPIVAHALRREICVSVQDTTLTAKSKRLLKHFRPVLSIFTNEKHDAAPILKRNSKLRDGPGIEHFLSGNLKVVDGIPVPYLNEAYFSGRSRKVYFDVYGCQMNVNDTEVVWSILKRNGYLRTTVLDEADIVLVVTCAIREGAESKVWNKLTYLKGLKNSRGKNKRKVPMKIGVLGCMAERLKEKLLEKEKAVDLIAGPDSYKDLPRLLALTENYQKAVNVQLSFEETYADITPVRLSQDSISAYVSIMRGCDNMCTYCIVPFTRGRERSRPLQSILNEVKHLSEEGVKEITLLGQNVNSYRDISEDKKLSEAEITHMTEGFHTVYKPKKGGKRFAELLDKVSEINPEMRVRFTSPHPKDFPDEVLNVIRERPNVCKSLHLPAQSGSSSVLERMGRGYTREAYLHLIDHVREIIPEVSFTSDFICGFCGETDEEFEDTLGLLASVEYNIAYIYPYSMREESKRSKADLAGRNDSNTKVIFSAEEIPETPNSRHLRMVEKGNYVAVRIHDANCQVLKGKALYHTSLQEFEEIRKMKE
ncbi:CDK5RAP1-like protein isoform X2 [Hetaerina americana]|uniref:CDK5RAP1-like protein isoform X2 n=1 Tax=Hetaerina americana TaxID=62018 RepID=UPI003A7F573A